MCPRPARRRRLIRLGLAGFGPSSAAWAIVLELQVCLRPSRRCKDVLSRCFGVDSDGGFHASFRLCKVFEIHHPAGGFRSGNDARDALAERAN